MDDDQLKNLFVDSSAEGFAPDFSDRVMMRLRTETERTAPLFVAALALRFRHMAVITLLLIIGLSVYNVTTPSVVGDSSMLEEALGVPPLTVKTAYTLDLTNGK